MAAKVKKRKTKEAEQSVRPWYSPSQIKLFSQEVKAEFLKIVWPDRKMTLGLTGVVVVLTVVLSLYLGSVDLLLGKLVSYVLR